MIRPTLLPAVAMGAMLAFASAHAAESTAPSAPSTDVIATVNGQPVRHAAFQQMLRTRQGVPNPFDPPPSSAPEPVPLDRSAVLADLLLTELLAQKARDAGLDRDPALQAELQMQARSTIAQHYVHTLIGTLSVNEHELRALYEEQIPALEFQVGHILVATEAEARTVIRQLDRTPARFASLARQHSTDAASRARGGALGWHFANQMTPEVAKVIRALTPGQYTRQPLQTDEGWHVFRLLATRPAPRPSLEEARAWLYPRLMHEKVQARLGQLRQQATIHTAPPP